LKRQLSNHFPLFSIIFGSALFSFTMGPFRNWDANYEFQAASGVLKYGVPYTAGPGTMINQPPLGFYIDSQFFRVFGLSFDVGAAIVTFFGVGCTLLVYLIGKAWYGKTSGLVASALFAVTPWQVVFSRSFLIDVQCLFFSLLFLLVGYYAIRKGSVRLFMLSGVIFGAAFLTKFYAVFMLFPLALLYFRYKPRLLWRPFAVAGFFLPVTVFLLAWYKGSIVTILWQDDFKFSNVAGSEPTISYPLTYLSGALGVFFLAASIVSILVLILQPKMFRTILASDLISLATVVLVVGFDAFLALALNFRAPFNSVVKYDYQALPFFCLLAGSISSKCRLLLGSFRLKQKGRWLLLGLTCLGAVFLIIAIFFNMYYVGLFSRQSIIIFKVEGSIAYSFSNLAPLSSVGCSVFAQYCGFLLVVLGLLWAIKDDFRPALNNSQQKLGNGL